MLLTWRTILLLRCPAQFVLTSLGKYFTIQYGVANVVAETAWLRNLLRELHYPLSTATLVYCDNVSAVYMSANPVQHQRTKHIEIDIHFVRDMVTAGQVRVLHVLSRYQYADIFTKGLPSALFEEFRSSLSVRPSPASTARAYQLIFLEDLSNHYLFNRISKCRADYPFVDVLHVDDPPIREDSIVKANKIYDSFKMGYIKESLIQTKGVAAKKALVFTTSVRAFAISPLELRRSIRG
ncbi:ribonuclease H-like domain-containing protein [Tanacetum coccineum]